MDVRDDTVQATVPAAAPPSVAVSRRLRLVTVIAAGALGATLAPATAAMIVARFVLGLAVGGASVTVPVHLAEISPADRRGALVTRNELMIVTGQLPAFTANAATARALARFS